jgi:putative transposase
MPQKNTVKIYVSDGIYHLYNRGIEKKDIFTLERDYRVFLNCLKEALLSPEKLKQNIKTFTLKGSSFKGIAKPPKNFFGQIELLAYCLMPNHFHLLLKQRDNRVIDHFMRSIGTRYSMFFNKTHSHKGKIFESIYKAINVTEEPYLLHLSRYIHRNSLPLSKDLVNAYSSYGDYLGLRKTEWVKPEIVLSAFEPTKLPFLKHTNTYKSFVEYDNEELDQYIDPTLALEDEE